MIVYTANFGGKDVFKEPAVVAHGVRYVYFTDQPFESDIWEVVPSEHAGPAMAARWYKLHPHTLFPEETTVWQDANLISTQDPTTLEWCNNMLLQDHPFRVDPYEEADYCIRKRKGDKLAVENQAADYFKNGLPRGGGLFLTRVLLRKPTEICTMVNELWWDQLTRFSHRDQISLPYVLWLLNTQFDTTSHELLKPYFLKKGGHLFRGN